MKKKKVIKILLACAVTIISKLSFAQTPCANSANIYSFTAAGINYEVVKELKTWTQAAACAVSRGGFLVHINSLSEQTAVYNGILNASVSTNYNPVATGGGASYVWIGATDKNIEGKWLWDGNDDNLGVNFWNGQGNAGAGGGTAVGINYNNWGGKSLNNIQEPDDYLSNQDYAGIALGSWPYGVAGEWNDINGATSLYYVIEYAICPTSINQPTITGLTDLCIGKSNTLQTTPILGADTYSWNSAINVMSVVVTPTITSNYSLVVGVTGCSITSNASITVTVHPKPTLTIISSNSAICIGNTVNLQAGGASTYTWGTGANTTSINIIPTVNTNYTLNGTSAFGCTNSLVYTQSVNPTPTLTITSSSSLICDGNSVNLQAGGASTYSWSTGANTSSLSITPTANTNYTLNGTNAFGCTNSLVYTQSVNPTPTLTITSSSSVICAGNSANLQAGGASTYTWSTGANTSSVSITPTTNTNYTLNGTNAFGCTNSLAYTQSVSACSFINGQFMDTHNFILYPNPTKDLITIQDGETIEKVMVTDLNGQIQDVLRTQNSIDISCLNKGIYFLQITTKEYQIVTKKIIKE